MKKKSFLQNFHTLPALCRTFGAGECEKAEKIWKSGGAFAIIIIMFSVCPAKKLGG
jgi:hypothetical protein